MRKLVISVALVALVACGGGGGGGESWIRFSPASLTAAFPQGHGDWVSLVGTASSEPDVRISIGVVLDQAAGRVFDQASQPSMLDTTSLGVSFHVSSSLSPGTYDGNIEVRVCEDANPRVCAQPYRGSPWRVPYHVVILAPGSVTVGPEMVRSGGFDAAMTNWDTWLMNGASATFGVTAGVLGAQIPAPTGDASNVQLKYVGGLNLVSGHVYRFSFDAWADASRSIDTTVWENGHELDGNGFAWSTYAYSSHDLTTTSQRFTVFFAMPLTNSDAGIGFFFGGSSAAVHLDNVSVVEVTGTGSGGGTSSGGTSSGGGTGALDFEDGQVATWLGAGDLVANDGEIGHPLSSVVFSQDDTLFQAGTASLKIAGPMVLNYWGTDYLTDVRAYLHLDRSTVDFTGRTLSVYFHLGAGTSTVDTVEVAVLDDQGRPSQGQYTVKTSDTWQHVTFNPGSDPTNYVRPGFDITRVQSIVLRISNPTGSVSEADWNVDSITW